MEYLYKNLADAVLLLHTLFVIFVIAALILTVIGGLRHWRWVRNIWFRTVHLVCIAVVVAQSWIGVLCPLTTLEVWLRRQAGEAAYDKSFIQYWLERLLYYDAPEWGYLSQSTRYLVYLLSSHGYDFHLTARQAHCINPDYLIP